MLRTKLEQKRKNKINNSNQKKQVSVPHTNKQKTKKSQTYNKIWMDKKTGVRAH